MPRAWFEQLVVSTQRPRRSRTGVAVSTLSHAGLLGALIVVPTLGRAQLPAVPDRAPIPTWTDIRPVPVTLAPRPPQRDTRTPTSNNRQAQGAAERRRATALPTGEIQALDPNLPEGPPACLTNCDPAGTDGAPELPFPGGEGDGAGAAASVPVRPGGDVREPRRIQYVAPEYPELARATRVAGIVILECVLDEQGRVQDVRVLRGHALLAPAAVDAVQRWRYTPTYLNGVAVRVVMTVTVNFTLNR
jgi:TonB family protein